MWRTVVVVVSVFEWFPRSYFFSGVYDAFVDFMDSLVCVKDSFHWDMLLKPFGVVGVIVTCSFCAGKGHLRFDFFLKNGLLSECLFMKLDSYLLNQRVLTSRCGSNVNSSFLLSTFHSLRVLFWREDLQNRFLFLFLSVYRVLWIFTECEFAFRHSSWISIWNTSRALCSLSFCRFLVHLE